MLMNTSHITRLFDILDHLKANRNKPDILCGKQNGEWRKYSVDEYIGYANAIASGLLELGLQKGDKVITIMNNRPEWNFMDMGIMLAGMVHVPVYPSLSQEEYTHVLNHSDAKCIVIGIESIFKRVSPVFPNLIHDPHIFTIAQINGQRNYEALLQLGHDNLEKWQPTIEQVKQETKPEELATIIYTSGTTGLPKGVMLSHKNFLTNALTLVNMMTNDQTANVLSFLPLCHVYERVINYMYQVIGSSMYYAEGLNTIARDLKDIHARGFCAVPRVLENMYDKFYNTGKSLKGIKRMIYFWAFNLGTDYQYYNQGWFYRKKIALADKLVYSQWRNALGGEDMIVVSGGSSIQAKVLKLFTAARLYAYEGYGMTETSPVIAVNNPMKNELHIGTVGEFMPCIEAKLADDGEILTKGDCLMMGYYKDPEYTSQVIDKEGWFHTGDIGTLVDGKYLKITDRKKEIFKLSIGKYIAPQVIENLLRESLFIDNCMVVGSNEDFASAIITADVNGLHYWCNKHKIPYEKDEDILKNPLVQERLQQEINKVNANLAAHEKLKNCRWILDTWSPLTGELSQTLKLRRAKLINKYVSILEDIYQHSVEDNK